MASNFSVMSQEMPVGTQLRPVVIAVVAAKLMVAAVLLGSLSLPSPLEANEREQIVSMR